MQDKMELGFTPQADSMLRAGRSNMLETLISATNGRRKHNM